ncbi:hypothetical protein PVAND_009689 [Polypedilum vanderplanki]|uniref:BHLH domain-containing protein n=1 Tax=Polypedilum vanderplanki TaxID=319348 RepID=A0A9J6CDI4_POLVA|nr:hypothetical protein PVAND_009689 [Polypedilum vanderplanki]
MNEDEISDAFNLIPNSIFDNIMLDTNNNFSMMNDIWDDDVLIKHSFEDIPLLSSEFETFSFTTLDDENEIKIDPMETKSNESSQVQYHDCMLSGTCTDQAHKTKKKYRFSHIDELIANYKDDDMSQASLRSNNFSDSTFVESNERITNLMKDFDKALGCLHKDEQSSRASQVPKNSQHVPEMPPPPPPIKFFVPIQSFEKSQRQPKSFLQYQKHSCNPKYYINDQLVKCESPMQLDVNELNQKEINNNDFNEQFKIENQSLSSEDSMPITPYYPNIKMENTNTSSSSASYLFYNNNLYTLDQLKSINFLEHEYIKNPCSSQETSASISNCYNQVDVAKKDKKVKQNKGLKVKTKKMKKSKVCKTKKSKKKVTSKTSNPYNTQNKYFFQFGEDEPIMKRTMHNCMERQRRIGLKNLFIELKQSIPELEATERVPKIAILREAANYCHELRNEEKELIELKKKNASLLKKYKRLLRNNA